MQLDERGDIAAAVIAFYAPVFATALYLTIRHGAGREAGWIFLLTFSLVRIVGGALHVAAERAAHPSIGLFIAAFALESAGIAPLLLCTTSFLAIVGNKTHTGHPLAQPGIWRLVRLLIAVAFSVSIAGASKAGSSDQGTRNTSATLRKVGAILLLVAFAVVAFLHLLFWTGAYKLQKHFRILLVAISTALPFLTVRMIYTVLSAFSPPANFANPSAPSKHTSLSKFNSFTGSWQIFLVMAFVMEYCVVLIYLIAGMRIPLHYADSQDVGGTDEEVKEKRNLN